MRRDMGYFEEQHLDKAHNVRLLRRLYPFSRPYRLLIGVSILLVMLITLLDLAVPYITKVAIDRYIVPVLEGSNTLEQKTIEKNKIVISQIGKKHLISMSNLEMSNMILMQVGNMVT